MKVINVLPYTDPFTKVKIMSEVALLLLLPYTDSLHQVENYVRGCAISTDYPCLVASNLHVTF
jgi:hypothetical protein